ncbi:MULTISPECIES: hypothetical protein [unclassified Blastococcus]
MTVEHDLPARLTALADELTWPDPDVSPAAVLARHRRRRRTRAGLVAAAAAVAALVVAVPTVAGSLSAAPGEVAGPGATTSTAGPTAEPDAEASAASASAAAESRQEEAGRQVAEQQAAAAAAATAAQQAAQPELDALAAALGGPVVLSSPAEWDRWLPGDKPYPGASTEEDISTCPRLADRLGAEFGMRFSYWTGTLPYPGGCTWVPVPLRYDGPYDYAYVVRVAFEGGTTVDQQRGQFVMGGGQDEFPGGLPCPSTDVPGGGALLRCGSPDARYDAEWTLVLPDARGGGVWTLAASAQTETGTSSAEALAVLVGEVSAIYG